MVKPQTSHTSSTAISTAEKEQELRRLMRAAGKVLVAYSGGVDSAYLAVVANQELGSDSLCVLGVSPSVSEFQRDEARRIAEGFSLPFETIATNELDSAAYLANNGDRCYFCKDELYGKLAAIADERNFAVVVDGTNADDVSDHRPGRVAAQEKNVRSPFVEVGLTKSEIRELSKKENLPTWDKPASPCLSSRIAYGVPVTIERLTKIERGEAVLRKLGFREFRVRLHDEIVRLEIAPAELPRALNIDTAGELARQLRKLGFRFVTLDLEGFRSGSLNDDLTDVVK